VADSVSFSTLDEPYRDGWLCFERVDGSDRRRLSMSHVPPDWDTLADERLDQLRRLAEPALRRSVPVGSETAERDREKGRG
jgi:hypothetical protein